MHDHGASAGLQRVELGQGGRLRHAAPAGQVAVGLRHACTLAEGNPEALLAELGKAVDAAPAHGGNERGLAAPWQVLDYAASRDAALPALWRGTGLDGPDLPPADLHLTPQQYLQLLQNAARVLDSTDTAFMLGQQMLPGDYGPASAALLRAGRLDDAETAFRTSFARTPSNGWALRGLMEVYRQRGDQAALAAAQKRFDATWLGRRSGPELSRL
eukprot:gene37538-46311_t